MKKVLIAAVASSLITGAVIAATGIAGSGNTSTKTSPPPTMAQAFKDMQKKRDEHLANVAKRLDITPEKLKDAMTKVRKDELQSAVDSNRLTEAERDAILACMDNPLTCDRSNLPAFGGREFRHELRGKRPALRGKKPSQLRRKLRTQRSDFLAALAKELDIDVAKVRAAFRAEMPKMGPGPGVERGFHRGGHPGPGFGPPPGGPDGGGPGAPGSFEGPQGPPGQPA